MSGFSPAWLALREAADHRSRAQSVAETLKTRFLQRETICVIDLGCGTGSNLRATAQLLPHDQHWTLVDHDAGLLAAGKAALIAWAETHEIAGDALRLTKGHARITVAFHRGDLVADLEAILDRVPQLDLVTASALFDLASASFIQRFAAAVAKRRAVFYSVLTYNGIQRWTPRSPADQGMSGAFHRHQVTDKGFGAACGPTAPVELYEQFETRGYTIEEGDSPWRLGVGDGALIAELATGFVQAIRETKAIPGAELDTWLKRTRTGAEVGHTDTLAIPGSGSGRVGSSDADED